MRLVPERALPLIMAVDEDAEALQRITAELQRYARDYRVICGPSTEAALEQLEAMRDRDKAVAVVLAARGTQELKGEQLLERVHELHPHAKRALLIPWGGWADEETADAIRARWRSGTSTTTRSSRGARRTSSSTGWCRSSSRSGGGRTPPGAASSRSSPTRGRREATSCGTSSPATACRTRSMPDSSEGVELLAHVRPARCRRARS